LAPREAVPSKTASRRRWTLLAALAAVLLLAAACSSSDDESSDGSETQGSDATTDGGPGEAPDESDLTPVDGGTLTFAVEADSDGYNPVLNRWSFGGHYIGSSIYDPLFVENGDGSMEGVLAESAEANADATVWTITLRDGVVFHDGTPFDAEAVAANIEGRRNNPVNAAALSPIEEVVVVDPLTVEVRMNTPWAGYDHTLAAQGGYMVAPSTIADPTADPVGTGPFRFVEWVQDSHVTVERNDDYWGEPAHLDGIRFEIIPDVIARNAALTAGDIDALHTPDSKSVLEIRENDDLVVYEHSSEPFHVLLNTAAPPFDNPTAREALAYGTNPESLILTIGGEEVNVPASSPFISTNPWHLEENGYPTFDPDRASELVAQYEEETDEPLRVTIKAGQGTGNDEAQALVEQWDAIGVDATFESLEQSAFLGEVIGGTYQAALWRNHSWIDPDFSWIFWISENAKGVGDVNINFTQIKNEELDTALNDGRATLDEDVRREAYDDVQRVLNEELSHLWLYEVVWGIGTQPDVHGFGDAVERGFSRQDAKVFWNDVWIEA
jgi:ABC-type transport system substrate-binding protein